MQSYAKSKAIGQHVDKIFGHSTCEALSFLQCKRKLNAKRSLHLAQGHRTRRPLACVHTSVSCQCSRESIQPAMSGKLCCRHRYTPELSSVASTSTACRVLQKSGSPLCSCSPPPASQLGCGSKGVVRRDTVPSNCTITTFNGKPSRFNSCFRSFSVAASQALHHQHTSVQCIPVQITSCGKSMLALANETAHLAAAAICARRMPGATVTLSKVPANERTELPAGRCRDRAKLTSWSNMRCLSPVGISQTTASAIFPSCSAGWH